MIDMSTVAPPDVVEPIDFEALLADLKAHMLARLPALADVLELESEPITKLLQLMAYREVLLRQRVNEAARAVMVAYAVGGDLEQIGANYGVARLPGETDARLRHRVQQAFNRLAAAGPANAYRQHALGVSADIRDVQVFSEAPGRVTVTVLAPHAVPKAEADATHAAAGLAL
ncbi:baseplate J/gp47 family protein, partial [Streptomyces sp. G35A]